MEERCLEEAPERGSGTTSRAVWILSAFSLLNAFLSLRKTPEETPSYLGQRRGLYGEVERTLSFKLNSVSVTNYVILVLFHVLCLRGFICEMGRKIFKDLLCMRTGDTGKELRMGLGSVVSLDIGIKYFG